MITKHLRLIINQHETIKNYRYVGDVSHGDQDFQRDLIQKQAKSQSLPKKEQASHIVNTSNSIQMSSKSTKISNKPYGCLKKGKEKSFPATSVEYVTCLTFECDLPVLHV